MLGHRLVGRSPAPDITAVAIHALVQTLACLTNVLLPTPPALDEVDYVGRLTGGRCRDREDPPRVVADEARVVPKDHWACFAPTASAGMCAGLTPLQPLTWIQLSSHKDVSEIPGSPKRQQGWVRESLRKVVC